MCTKLDQSNNLTIGNEIKKLMIDKNISTNKLSSMLNIARSTLYRKLNGHLDFSRKEIEIIMNEFKLSDNQVMKIFFTKKVS